MYSVRVTVLPVVDVDAAQSCLMIGWRGLIKIRCRNTLVSVGSDMESPVLRRAGYIALIILQSRPMFSAALEGAYPSSREL